MRELELARRNRRTSWKLSSSLLLWLSLGGLGCELLPGRQPAPPMSEDKTAPSRVRVTGGLLANESVTGARTLEASAEDDSGRVEKMEFLISDSLACTDATARESGATFSCSWDSSGMAPGAYLLIARAYDAAGNASSSEPIAFTIPEPNERPTITSFTAEPVSITEGTSTTLTVVASDADGDALGYTWSQAAPAAPEGTFGTEPGASRTWTAPTLSSTTTYSLVVTVSDGKGGSTPAAVDVEVVNDPSANQLPVVDAVITVSSATALAGDTLELSIGASDPDGDALTYAWTTSPAASGSFTAATAATTQWHAPEVAQASPFTLLVTVSDGTDSVTRSVDVQVNVPSYATHIQPIWDQACISCHNNSTSGRGGLTLEAGNSHASLVNATGTTSLCTSFKRVQPYQPDSSLLVKKISGTSCGTRMPQDDTAWFDTHPEQLTRIRSWILAGAAND